MRYAIIADIHANLAAFMAVLSDVKERGGVEEIWCLGDIVGYGPDPHDCIELLRQTRHVCVVGNHDLAAVGQIDNAEFNPDAIAASEWTATKLNQRDVNYIRSLPRVVKKNDFTLVHGSPREPIWEYVLSISGARENFAHFNTPFCLLAHTHVPAAFSYGEGGACSFKSFAPDKELVPDKERLIINPGAVGQPRDGDPRASYAIYDSEQNKFWLYRVPYDVTATQSRMVEEKLPMRLVARLSHGV
ncbi:MAG: metallophosphoesterase family protein [Dehalococcoidia bacterium]|jgi:predicted phosphodiesterase